MEVSFSNMTSSSSPSSMYSWSNLPLDLLISIKERIYERSDLLSFRSVCSQWRSSIPAPKHLQLYKVYCNQTDINFENGIARQFSITSPFHFSYKLSFLAASNGWLIFKNQYNSYHLFDPLSHQKHLLPRLTRKKIRGKFKRATGSMIELYSAAVSLRPDGIVIVAGIADVHNRRGTYIYEKFVSYRIGKDNCWNISKQSCKGMFQIVGDVDGNRFYATDQECGLYVLEVEPRMRSKKYNLVLPEHLLYNDYAEKQKGQNTKFSPYCIGMREMSGEYRNIYGHGIERLDLGLDYWLVLKLKRLELCVDNTNVNVYSHIYKWTKLVDDGIYRNFYIALCCRHSFYMIFISFSSPVSLTSPSTLDIERRNFQDFQWIFKSLAMDMEAKKCREKTRLEGCRLFNQQGLNRVLNRSFLCSIRRVRRHHASFQGKFHLQRTHLQVKDRSKSPPCNSEFEGSKSPIVLCRQHSECTVWRIHVVPT
ncbi:hypothetical protein KSP40_PGU000926 [Platanthera guangdongensis]|uniref:KIB1-4 beta-propeller domain-containing protein n=1 Tax=Platanthera guangdongensis TaxID=2320717 RepID=A0ABR2MR19_9ASPA